ncbi:MAG: hypothetical protein U0670_17405 [Anaerolineae bacterium]
MLHWFGSALSDRIQGVLRDRGAFIRQWMQPAALDVLLSEHFSGRAPQVEVVFRLLNLELWARKFVC